VTAIAERARAELVAAELLAPVAPRLQPDEYDAWRDLLALAYLKGARYVVEAFRELVSP